MTSEPKGLTETTESHFIPSLRELLRVIRQRLFVVLIVLIAFVGTMLGLSMLQTPQYQASILILIGQEQNPNQPSSLVSDVQGLQQFTRTAAQVVQTLPVAEGAIQELNLDMSPEEFVENISVEPVADTQVIRVSYRDPDPQSAKQIADTIGEVFSGRVSEVSPNANAVTATLWERALVPEAPVSPDLPRTFLLAIVLGTIVGVGLALLLEYFDDTWRSPQEVEQISSLPIYGVIPEFQISGDKKGRYK